jgi:GH15 family glucan-1,4-alpha-glucosidase
VLVLVRRGAHPRRALDEARLAFEKMLSYANHLGLYAEQISGTGQQQGNFPRR